MRSAITPLLRYMLVGLSSLMFDFFCIASEAVSLRLRTTTNACFLLPVSPLEFATEQFSFPSFPIISFFLHSIFCVIVVKFGKPTQLLMVLDFSVSFKRWLIAFFRQPKPRFRSFSFFFGTHLRYPPPTKTFCFFFN